MTVEQQLRDHDLRVTEVRKQLYAFFRATPTAVSHADLELEFTPGFDRVTIYRTLNTFLEKGILHKIPNDSGSARYALCHTDCDAEQHFDNHVHFKCTVCEQLTCLHDMKIPHAEVPGNYLVQHAVLLYEGVCERCNRDT